MRINEIRHPPQLDQRSYLLCRSRSHYQPSYHILNFNAFHYPITNTSTSKNDSVADGVDGIKVIENKNNGGFASFFS